MQLPVWCACGRVVTHPGEDRCEACWANDQERYQINRHGKSRKIKNVSTMLLPDPPDESCTKTSL